MKTMKQLDKHEWKEYFDAFSRTFIQSGRVDYAEIRAFSPDVGMQPETSWLPLIGITYDPKDDLLEIAVENMDHLIYRPQEIYVEEEEGHLVKIEVVEKGEKKEFIELR